ncbi:C4-dicarboxylate-specific signal transduction histidine kinase [Methylovirgula ligni]|uniref:histidine kinase n=1 Tax=Methylovirgula ligni TaxID=569860 RepID=A0A3D9YY25_9HYPH|nr:ATP-binding protein [Methylovirgula ligni]REF87551.1 C4-dicarboxylate-specific signal transduction histidine kinase [Methylovirgula ligni]
MIVVFGILLVALAATGAALSIREFRVRDVAEARRELMALDLLLSQETERTMQSVDLVLSSLQDDLTLGGITKPQDIMRKRASVEMYLLLKSRIVGIPQIHDVSLIGPDGKLICTTKVYPAPESDLSGRDYFTVLRDVEISGSYLSLPSYNEDTKSWSIYLARRVDDASGHFLGVVAAAIDLNYFEQLYKTLQIGDYGAVSLWRSDGTMLARYPAAGRVGEVYKIKSFTGILQPGTPVTYDSAHAIDGPERIVATISVDEFPLVVNISRLKDHILADWRQARFLIAAGAVLFAFAISFVLWLLIRHFNTYEALMAADRERSKAVAERERAEAQLRQAQKLESIGQLTGGIAHDFNNLLTAVLGNLEMLKRHTEKGEARLHRWATNAFDAARRGAVLTQRLLVFSRRQPLEPRGARIETILASMSDLLARTLGENIEIVTTIAPGLWPAFADLNQLDNAILNIAINARDAMEGRGRLTITASNCAFAARTEIEDPEITPGDYVLLSIEDTGKGIDREILDRVFEPFFSTKPTGQGTGLGLSQVYGFVKQTGGHVRIESIPSSGTTVRLYLPRAQSEDVLVESEPLAERALLPGPAGTVLVVEDDAEVRTYSAEILRDLGFEVRVTENAAQALEILRGGTELTLLFSDVGLPGVTGAELAEEALKLRPELKVLLTTGYVQDTTIDRCRFVLGIQVLPKPFTRAELADKITSVLTPVRRLAVNS